MAWSGADDGAGACRAGVGAQGTAARPRMPASMPRGAESTASLCHFIRDTISPCLSASRYRAPNQNGPGGRPPGPRSTDAARADSLEAEPQASRCGDHIVDTVLATASEHSGVGGDGGRRSPGAHTGAATGGDCGRPRLTGQEVPACDV